MNNRDMPKNNIMVSGEIEAYRFREGLNIEFELVDLQTLYREHRDMLIRPHRTGFYHIIWFKNKSANYIVDFQKVPVTDGSLLFLNKDTVQLYMDDEALSGTALLFTEHFFCKSADDSRFLKSTILFHDLLSIVNLSLNEHSEYLKKYFEFIQIELTNPPGMYQTDILRNILHNLLLASERERKSQGFTEIRKGADLDYIILFRDLLETDFYTNKRVSYFAQKLFVTEKRLNQATSKILGKSPKQMIDERVVLECKRLLVHTNESIKEIGYRLGFEETTNFSSILKNTAA